MTLTSFIKSHLPPAVKSYLSSELNKIRHPNISFQTYNDLSDAVRKLILKLPYQPELVVGVPRSGMVPAYMVAAYQNIPVCSLDEYIAGIPIYHGITRPLSQYDNKEPYVLLIDDSIASGNSLITVKARLLKHNIKIDNIKVAAVYATNKSKGLVDYYGVMSRQYRLFQWNYLSHYYLTNSCMDIDGVLCVNPTEYENDDGERYMQFLKTAKPLIVPPYRIHALVTSRLEKYREVTEEWLARNNIKYDALYMLDMDSAAERQKFNTAVAFKSKIYKSLKETNLFIESEEWEAETIARLTKKQVICSTTNTYYK